MATAAQTFSSLVNTVMRTPLDAVAGAEHQYLTTWRDRLATISELNETSPLSADQLKATLEHAPHMKLVGSIQIAATVRLASVRESRSGLEFTIGTGPIGVSGGFGSLSRSAEESMIQISAQFKITNGEITLLDYLKNVGHLELAKPGDIKNAIAFLDQKVDETSKSMNRE